MGLDELDDLTLRTLRSWLAKQQTLGRARTTLARRATAVRVFTAWARHTGRTREDVGASLGSPKAHRTLPGALSAERARLLLDAAAERADGPGSQGGVATIEAGQATQQGES